MEDILVQSRIVEEITITGRSLPDRESIPYIMGMALLCICGHYQKAMEGSNLFLGQFKSKTNILTRTKTDLYLNASHYFQWKVFKVFLLIKMISKVTILPSSCSEFWFETYTGIFAKITLKNFTKCYSRIFYIEISSSISVLRRYSSSGFSRWRILLHK